MKIIEEEFRKFGLDGFQFDFHGDLIGDEEGKKKTITVHFYFHQRI